MSTPDARLIFASKTGRDLTTDPAPWWHDHETLCEEDRTSGDHAERSAWKEAEEDEYRPRARFDHTQHHPGNPLLAAARRARQGNTAAGLADVIADAGTAGATREHFVHAQRVFARLDALTLAPA
jgi:hypothetical protein